MKNLTYATIASDSHSIQVSTWKQAELTTDGQGALVENENWHYKFSVDGKVVDEGVLGPVEESVNADHE